METSPADVLAIKKLLFRFLMFIGIFIGLGRLNFMVVVVGVGVVMACIAFLHILATPLSDSA
jgi:hypothetical protein